MVVLSRGRPAPAVAVDPSAAVAARRPPATLEVVEALADRRRGQLVEEGLRDVGTELGLAEQRAGGFPGQRMQLGVRRCRGRTEPGHGPLCTCDPPETGARDGLVKVQPRLHRPGAG